MQSRVDFRVGYQLRFEYKVCRYRTKCCDYIYPVLLRERRPTWAWKPDLIAATERREPQDSQLMKKIRFSFVSSVSGLLHVLQVTYSTMYLRAKSELGCEELKWHEADVPTQDVFDLLLQEATLDD